MSRRLVRVPEDSPFDAETPPFLPFAEKCLADQGSSLTPAQRVLCKVAFDGVPPSELSELEADLCTQIFGPIRDEHVGPGSGIRDLVAVCGARAGKSHILIGLRMLHLAMTVSLERLASGEVASAIIVARDLKLARQTLRFVKGAALRRMPNRVADENADHVTIMRDGGKAVTIECLPASAGGAAVRGRSLVGFGMDEAAFFRDDAYVVNDAEIYRALAPRVIDGGQGIIASTPWAEAGLLYKLYSENWGSPKSALACRAPTLLMRGHDPKVVKQIEGERRRDPDNAAREFDAEFMSGAAGGFFDSESVSACVRSPSPRIAGGKAYAGADFAFRSDSSALVIVGETAESSKDGGSTWGVLYWAEMKPKPGKPLIPENVCHEFARALTDLGCFSVMADHHYLESVREHMSKRGVSVVAAPSGRDGVTKTYLAAREMMRKARVQLPDAPRILHQLSKVVSHPVSGGGVVISQPRSPFGGHGDIVSGLVLALWQASGRGAVSFADGALSVALAQRQLYGGFSEDSDFGEVASGGRVIGRTA